MYYQSHKLYDKKQNTSAASSYPCNKKCFKMTAKSTKEKKEKTNTHCAQIHHLLFPVTAVKPRCVVQKYKSQQLYWKIQLFIVNPLSLHGE